MEEHTSTGCLIRYLYLGGLGFDLVKVSIWSQDIRLDPVHNHIFFNMTHYLMLDPG